MLQESLISVIVPIYNIEEYVANCIESIQTQTYCNLEIILVDDGSIDNSGDICEKYAAKDERIIVFHKKNGGLSDARNYALDRVKGDLIAFVDGDDWIHPQMYELMYDIMNQQKAEVVACKYVREGCNFAKEVIDKTTLDIKLLSGEEALLNAGIPLVVAWNKLYRRDIFADIRYPVGRLHEDEFVLHKILWKCSRVAVIDRPLYFYTVRNDSIVAQMTLKRINDSLEAFADRVAFADEHNWSKVMPTVVKRYCDYCIDGYYDIKSGKYDLLDESYLDTLWRSEHDMLDRYRDIDIDEKYRRFAKSPDDYDRWLAKIARINRYKSLIRGVAYRIALFLGIKKRANKA